MCLHDRGPVLGGDHSSRRRKPRRARRQYHYILLGEGPVGDRTGHGRVREVLGRGLQHVGACGFDEYDCLVCDSFPGHWADEANRPPAGRTTTITITITITVTSTTFIIPFSFLSDQVNRHQIFRPQRLSRERTRRPLGRFFDLRRCRRRSKLRHPNRYLGQILPFLLVTAVVDVFLSHFQVLLVLRAVHGLSLRYRRDAILAVCKLFQHLFL